MDPLDGSIRDLFFSHQNTTFLELNHSTFSEQRLNLPGFLWLTWFKGIRTRTHLLHLSSQVFILRLAPGSLDQRSTVTKFDSLLPGQPGLPSLYSSSMGACFAKTSAILIFGITTWWNLIWNGHLKEPEVAVISPAYLPTHSIWRWFFHRLMMFDVRCVASFSSASSRSRRCSSFSNLPKWRLDPKAHGLQGPALGRLWIRDNGFDPCHNLLYQVAIVNMVLPHPVTVTTRMLRFLEGDFYQHPHAIVAESSPSCGASSICLSLVILNIQYCQSRVTSNRPTISNQSQKGISDDMLDPTQEHSLTNTMWLRDSTLYKEWMHLSCSALLLLSVSCLKKARVPQDFQLESSAGLTMFRRVPIMDCSVCVYLLVYTLQVIHHWMQVNV